MKTLVDMLRGWRGHPAHPPLTDATIGAFTVATAAAMAGWFGFEARAMATSSFVGVVAGLILAMPTIGTGFVDYLRIRRGTPLWNAATIHWLLMVVATGGYLWSAPLLHAAHRAGTVSGPAAAVAAGSFALLLAGGWVGGSVVFVYGMRVVGEADKPAGAAILEPEFPPD